MGPHSHTDEEITVVKVEMVEEVAPGIHRLPLPLEGPLGSVNTYVVEGDDGVLLVDCGWNTPDAYAALEDGLASIGYTVAGIRTVAVTHIHPDHIGLAARIVKASHAAELMHRRDAALVGARYEDARGAVAAMEAWLRANGSPDDEVEATAGASLWMLSLVDVRKPDVLLAGGETINCGRYAFEVIPTPGHSQGLYCLYDRSSGVFLSSDHVLERISPHIGLHTQSSEDPLREYLDALRRVRDLPVSVVLPGHGDPFHDLAGRVDGIARHHDERCARMLQALGDGEATAYTVASRLPWRGSADGWRDLAPFDRRMAVTETVAHLEHMALDGRLTRSARAGLVRYARSPRTPQPMAR